MVQRAAIQFYFHYRPKAQKKNCKNAIRVYEYTIWVEEKLYSGLPGLKGRMALKKRHAKENMVNNKM